MSWVDWSIVIVLALSALGGMAQGFFRAVFSLGGLFAGLTLAAWNYDWLSGFVKTLLPVGTIADAVSFLVIAVATMVIANLIGAVLSRTVRGMGLGCLDRLVGGLFGLFQGFLLITVVVLVAVAFFPRASWLTGSKLPKRFFGMCQLSTRMSPADLSNRIRVSLHDLETSAPGWLHPGTKGK